MLQWTEYANALGVPLEKLMRADGKGLVTREDWIVQVGAERFHAQQAIGRAIVEGEWRLLSIKTSSRLAKATVEEFDLHAHIPEIKAMLRLLRTYDHVTICSQQLHYLKRRYVDGLSIESPGAYNEYYEQPLRDGGARIFRQGPEQLPRYAVYSPESGWVSVVDDQGRRVTAFSLRPGDHPDDLGAFLWTITDLIG